MADKPRGMPTQGAQLYFKKSDAATDWLKLEGLNQMDGPRGTSDDIDVTDFDSEVAQSISGLPNFGEISLGGNYLDIAVGPNQVAFEKMYADSADPFPVRLCLPVDATKTKYIVKEFNARVASFELSAKIIDKQSFTSTLKVVSKPTRVNDVAVADLTKDTLP